MLFALNRAVAQVATIQDVDGWTNVRASPKSQSDVIHVIHENEVFWYSFEQSDREHNWVTIYIPKNDYSLGKTEPDYVVGYIHKSRLLPLSEMTEYTGANFSMKYILGDFDPTSKLLDGQNKKQPVTIDGRPFWGTDGESPTTQVENIEVVIDGKEITIHNVFFNDIYECNNEISVFKNGNTYIVHHWNSDGAGAYEIVWVFDNAEIKQRLVGTIL